MSLKSFNGEEMTTTFALSVVTSLVKDVVTTEDLCNTMLTEYQEKKADDPDDVYDDPELFDALWQAMTDSLDRAIENELSRRRSSGN